MFGDNIFDPNEALEVQNILDIEASEGNFDDIPPDQGDEDEDHDDDFFGHCDINGNENTDNSLSVRPTSNSNVSGPQETFFNLATSLSSCKVPLSCERATSPRATCSLQAQPKSDTHNGPIGYHLHNKLSHLNASIKEALDDIKIEQETVSYNSVVPSPSFAPSFSCDNKNGLLHMSYTIDKSISTPFPECEIPNLIFYHNKFTNSTEKQTGPLDHYLFNSDFTNVMQELHSSSMFLEKQTVNNVTNSETVLNLAGVASSSALSSPVGNTKNGPHDRSKGNNVPETNDSDATINAYLDKSYPKYVISNTSEDTADHCVSPFGGYEKFPIFSTSYCNSTKKVVNYKSTRPDWEPYDWFFSQIRWSNKSDSEHTYSFCELAIAAHILTGGATSPNQDLCTKTNCMNLAFKRFFQKQKIGGESYKEFFQPSSKVKTLTSIGCDNVFGIRRTPYFNASPSILKEVRLIAWKAVQHWEVSARIARFGEDFLPKSRTKSCWTPDSVVWLYTTMDKKKQDKLAISSNLCNNSENLISSAVFASAAWLPDTNKNAHTPDLHSRSAAAVIVCFYGHKVSSSTDLQGREQWRFSPTPPWPNVPPARPLCQRCYLYHRASALRGESQYSFAHLYHKQKNNPTPLFIGGASSSTERPPG
jgi:hypothetical protein